MVNSSIATDRFQFALHLWVRLCGIALIVFVGLRPLQLFRETQASPAQAEVLESNLLIHAVMSPLLVGLAFGLLQVRPWSVVMALLIAVYHVGMNGTSFVFNAFITPLWISPETGEWVRWHPEAFEAFIKALPFALLFWLTWRRFSKSEKPDVSLALG